MQTVLSQRHAASYVRSAANQVREHDEADSKWCPCLQNSVLTTTAAAVAVSGKKLTADYYCLLVHVQSRLRTCLPAAVAAQRQRISTLWHPQPLRQLHSTVACAAAASDADEDGGDDSPVYQVSSMVVEQACELLNKL